MAGAHGRHDYVDVRTTTNTHTQRDLHCTARQTCVLYRMAINLCSTFPFFFCLVCAQPCLRTNEPFVVLSLRLRRRPHIRDIRGLGVDCVCAICNRKQCRCVWPAQFAEPRRKCQCEWRRSRACGIVSANEIVIGMCLNKNVLDVVTYATVHGLYHRMSLEIQLVRKSKSYGKMRQNMSMPWI